MNDSVELPALAMSIDDEVKAEAVDHPVVSLGLTLLQLRLAVVNLPLPSLHDNHSINASCSPTLYFWRKSITHFLIFKPTTAI